MPALANVALTDTFDVWRTRTNQIIVRLDQIEISDNASFGQANAAYAKANSAVLSANLDSVSASRYLVFGDSVTGGLSRANMSYGLTFNPSTNTLTTNNITTTGNVGIGTSSPPQGLAVGNSTDQVGAGISGAISTLYFGAPSSSSGGIKRIAYDRASGNLNFIGGSVASPSIQMTLDNDGNLGIGNTVPTVKLQVNGAANIGSYLIVGGANVLPTIAGANTAVGTGANSYAAAIGTAANSYMISVQNGSNTAVGTGANTYLLATLAGANTAVGTGANTYLLATIAGANTAVGTGANTVGSAAFAKANTSSAVRILDDSVNATRYVTFANTSSGNTASLNVTSAYLTWNPGTVVFTSWHIQASGALGVGTAPSTTPGEIRASGDITAYYSSDISLKTNIDTIPNALDKVMQIRGVGFDWKDSYMNERGGEDGYFVRKRDVGIIAQEIEKVLPEVVASRENGIKAVRYEKLVALLIEAIKELNNKIENK